MSTQRAVDKWEPFFPSPPSFFFFLSLLAHAEPRTFPILHRSPLLRSNLVEFSWVDILLSSRAYLYLAFESSGPFARFANCTIALAFCALRKKKEKERKGEAFSLVPDS